MYLKDSLWIRLERNPSNQDLHDLAEEQNSANHAEGGTSLCATTPNLFLSVLLPESSVIIEAVKEGVRSGGPADSTSNFQNEFSPRSNGEHSFPFEHSSEPGSNYSTTEYLSVV